MKRAPKLAPKLVIFDVDGVLVDVHGSFHRSILDTVKHFTGRRFTYDDIQQWKSQSGYNDDWRLSTDWVNSLGTKAEYAEVKRVFQKMYWGTSDKRGGKRGSTRGNVWRERWLVSPRLLERWAKRAELALFTGRNRRELRHTLKHFGVGKLFSRTVTMDDVKRLKPDPEGLLRLLDGNEPESALYLGDNLDDALASKRAGVPFLGVLPQGSEAHRVRAGQLRRHGARVILHSASELEKYWK